MCCSSTQLRYRTWPRVPDIDVYSTIFFEAAKNPLRKAVVGKVNLAVNNLSVTTVSVTPAGEARGSLRRKALPMPEGDSLSVGGVVKQQQSKALSCLCRVFYYFLADDAHVIYSVHRCYVLEVFHRVGAFCCTCLYCNGKLELLTETLVIDACLQISSSEWQSSTVDETRHR